MTCGTLRRSSGRLGRVDDLRAAHGLRQRRRGPLRARLVLELSALHQLLAAPAQHDEAELLAVLANLDLPGHHRPPRRDWDSTLARSKPRRSRLRHQGTCGKETV